MTRGLIPGAWLLTAIAAPAQSPLIARARSLELSTPYVPPPGDPLEHHAAGFAKIICSAVFVTGLAPEFAAENLGFFTAPYEERAKLEKPVIDRARRAVHVTLSHGVTRTALYLGDQGCVTDRKSTRLNSSHLVISYAVFCLKKKNTMMPRHCVPRMHSATARVHRFAASAFVSSAWILTPCRCSDATALCRTGLGRSCT